MSTIYGDGRAADERLYRSLRLDATMPQDQMAAITRTVVEKNLHLMDEGSDYWVGQRITRGVLAVEGDN